MKDENNGYFCSFLATYNVEVSISTAED